MLPSPIRPGAHPEPGEDATRRGTVPIIALTLAAATAAPLPAGTPSGWDARCTRLVDEAAADGVGPSDLHRVLAALGWRAMMDDRRTADALLDRLAAAADDPLVAGELRSWRARLAVEEGRPEAARELFRAGGGLERWWAAGPFPVEELADLDDAAPVPPGGPWRRAAGTDATGWVNLEGIGWPTERQMLYLATTVAVDARTAVAFRLGAAGGARLWVDGRPVLSTPHPLVRGEDQFAGGAWLGPGRHVVVAAVGVERGGWWFRLRLTRPDGGPLAGVRELDVAPEPPPAAPAGPAPEVATLRGLLEEAAARGEPGARIALAAFLVERRPEAVGSGAERAACREAREEAPALARWFEWLVTDEPGERRDLLRWIVADDPGFVPARVELAMWLHRRGLHEEAHALVSGPEARGGAAAATALDLDADLWGALALPELQRAAARFPRCVRLLTVLARRAMDGDRWELARQAVDALTDLVPGARGTRSLAGRLAVASGDQDGLMALLEGRLRSDPNDLEARLRLARLKMAAGDTAAADRLLGQGTGRCPGHPRLTMEYAGLQHLLGHDGEAVRLARSVLEARPQDRRAQRFLELLGSGGEDRSWILDAAALRRMAEKAAPDGAWVQLLDHHEVRFLPGNLTEERVQTVFLVRDPDRSDPLRQRTIAVVPERQRLRVLAARILRGSGEISAEQGDTPRLSEPEFNLYYDTRLRVLRFPRFEAGDIVEVTYLLSETAESNDTGAYRGGIILLAGPVPVLRTEVILDAPSGGMPAWELAGTDLTPERETVDGRERLHFVWTDTPAVPADIPPPPRLAVTPHLVYSTRPEWGDLAAWYERHVAPRLRPSEATRTLAERLTASAAAREERIRALYSYVTDEIRYVGLEFGEHRFRPFSPDWVVRHRMGDCKDKAALLVTLLREVGIPARMVLLRTADLGPVVSRMALLEDFNHAIAYLPEDDLWLDGTASGNDARALPGLDRNAWALVVDGAGSSPRTTPSGPAGERVLRFVVGRGDGTGAAVPVSVSERSTGDAALALRNVLAGSQDPARFERWFRRWFPGGTVEGRPEAALDPGRDPASVRIEGTVPLPAIRAGRGLRAYPGVLELERTLTPTEQRRSPLLVTARPRFRWSVVVAAGPDVPLPAPERIETDRVRFTLDVERTGTGYRVDGALELVPGMVPPDRVPAFREALGRVERAVAQRLEVR